MYKKIDLKLKIIIFTLNMKKLSYHEKQLIIDIKKNKRRIAIRYKSSAVNI